MAESAASTAPVAPVLAHSAPTKDTEMIHVFTLDDREFYIPAKPRMNIALKYLYEVQHKSEAIANVNLLVSLLGEDNYEALMNYEDLTAENLETIMAIAAKAVLGESTVSSPNS